ncbi:MAG: OmpA family protein [Bacteroidetes bacterium]|nr:OmpA family protein [Bacteroidota bacterium]MBS1932158.1 OmpA family protein [Bacteroidota bacterium]
MKKILSALFICTLMISTAFGQDDEIRPPAFGISFTLNDFVSPARIRSTSLSHVLANNQMAKLRDMVPGVAINYFKGLSKHIDFAASLGGSLLDYPMTDKTFIADHLLVTADAQLNLKMTTEKYWVQPYITAGLGAQSYYGYYGAYIPMGLGLKVNLMDEEHIFLTSQYRVPVTTETSSYHLFYSLGFASTNFFGKKKPKVVTPPPPPPPTPVDTDKDGIPDDKDKCPTVPGLAKYDGCPIPDTDKDGINDEEDKCPTIPGLARYQGCPIPDTDKDGINDEEDKCPTVPGLARYQGCPIPDTDGDGVNDEEDKCPNLPGVKENQGCPLIQEEVKKKVDYAAHNILFVTGSYKLAPKSFKGLNDVVKILNENPEIKLSIDGHTDNVGKEDKNQVLSENRANAVMKYFVSKGISESRITSSGHGDTMPIADNKTAAGRQKNRRVELKLSYY